MGGFSFTSSDGRSGSCAVDVTFSDSMDLGGLVEIDAPSNATTTGTICGLNASGFPSIGTAEAT
jgi:hypothetical protein